MDKPRKSDTNNPCINREDMCHFYGFSLYGAYLGCEAGKFALMQR